MSSIRQTHSFSPQRPADYDRDLVAWALENAALLRAGRTEEIDALHIAEELEDLGKSERRALSNHLRNLTMHLLKWQYQPAMRTGSWRSSIDNARAEIAEILDDSPSLRPVATGLLTKVYGLSRRNATSETGLPEDIFPSQCPYSLGQVLADDYWPDNPA